jgi:hypothetical protein
MTEIRIEMSADDLRALVEEAVRSGLADVGLHTDDADRIEEARADLRFLRRLRQTVDGAGIWVGRAILMAIVSGAITLIVAGTKGYLAK